MSFLNKIAFITGGSSGMGLETARLLLAEGASVVVFDRNRLPDDLQAQEGDLHFVPGDASSAADVAGALAVVRERHGRLDLAVNAAGITGRLAPMLDQTDDALDQLLAVNVRGVFLAMKHEAALMREGGGGAIVNFSSVYASGSHHKMILYGATKHAVRGLTEGAAVELAACGIRVNAVAPGPIRTPFIGEVSPEIESAVARGIPQGRIGEASEVGPAVLWLLSDAATYVTGATLTIDGGQAALLAG